MRLLTDFQIALLVASVIWGAWYLIPALLDAITDPYRDRFTDVDELVERER